MSDRGEVFAERTVVFVDDIDGAVRDFDAVLGMKLKIVEVEHRSGALRVALGPDGVELVKRPEGLEIPPVSGVLAAIALRVPDGEEYSKRLQDAGFELHHVTDVPNGSKEYNFGTSFHGLPLVLYAGPVLWN